MSQWLEKCRAWKEHVEHARDFLKSEVEPFLSATESAMAGEVTRLETLLRTIEADRPPASTLVDVMQAYKKGNETLDRMARWQKLRLKYAKSFVEALRELHVLAALRAVEETRLMKRRMR